MAAQPDGVISIGHSLANGRAKLLAIEWLGKDGERSRAPELVLYPR